MVVERASKDGPENRDHLVMITGRWTNNGAQWYIKDRASFTNKYNIAPVQQTFTIRNEIKGKPSTAQTFSFRLRRVSDSQIATVKINANSTKTKNVKLPSFTKPGTYEYRITEMVGTGAGFNYNTEGKTYKLKYVVKDNGKGKLNVTTYVDGEKVKDEKPVLTFKNKYEVKVKIQYVDSTTSKGVSGGKSQIMDKSDAVVKKTWKSDGTPKEFSITADGTYTIKEVKAPTGYQMAADTKFTVKDGKVSTGKTIKIPHVPIAKAVSIKSIKASGNTITVDWKKTTEKVTGYQISYSTTKYFSSGVKTINVSDRNSTSATIKNLKNKTRYYVRMRTYKKTSGTDYDYYTYGAWSEVKSVKTE